MKELNKAIKELEKQYENATKGNMAKIIYNPLAYALYQTWRIFDAKDNEVKKYIPRKTVWHKNKPRKSGTYLVVTKSIGTHISIANFAKNLYKIDNYDFYDAKKSGWYKYDSEYGYYEITNVVAWTELPEYEEVIASDE